MSSVDEIAQNPGTWIGVAFGGLALLSALVNRKSDSEKRRDELKGKAQDQEAVQTAREHDTLEQVLAKSDARHAKLEAKCDRLEERSYRQQEEISKCREEIAGLKATSREQETTIVALRKELLESRAETADEVASHTKTRGILSELQTRHAETVEKLEELQLQMNEKIRAEAVNKP